MHINVYAGFREVPLSEEELVDVRSRTELGFGESVIRGRDILM